MLRQALIKIKVAGFEVSTSLYFRAFLGDVHVCNSNFKSKANPSSPSAYPKPVIEPYTPIKECTPDVITFGSVGIHPISLTTKPDRNPKTRRCGEGRCTCHERTSKIGHQVAQ